MVVNKVTPNLDFDSEDEAAIATTTKIPLRDIDDHPVIHSNDLEIQNQLAESQNAVDSSETTVH